MTLEAPLIPEYRDYISAGTYVIGALILATQGVVVAWLTSANRRGERRVKKALDDHPTSNGFTADMKDRLDKLEKSTGAMHGRLDRIMDGLSQRDNRSDQLLIRIDDRLTRIEDNQHGEENSN